MLQTTVAYLSLIENKRHNLETESQGRKQLGINQAQLAVNQGELEVHRGQLAETSRHNQVTEAQQWFSLHEQQRHNLATESINAYDANTRRMQLDINWFNADTQRYSAQQQAAIGWANVGVASMNAETNRMSVENTYSIGLRNAEIAQQQADIKQQDVERQQWRDQQEMWAKN